MNLNDKNAVAEVKLEHNDSTRKSVCLVCQEFAGPTRCGGVGTAFRALATALAEYGCRVTVLLTADELVETSSIYWNYRLRVMGINLVHLPRKMFRGNRFDGRAESSYNCYQWLKRNRFDVVHFHDWMGLGYYSLLAKSQGMAFAETTLCIGIHGPEEWAHLGNGVVLNEARQLEMREMEKSSVQLADVCVSPSRFMANWVKANEWRQGDTLVIPNLFREPYQDMGLGHRVGGFNELVLFGRLEARKGLYIFCDAIERLFETGAQIEAVTFLGARQWLRDRHEWSDVYIDRRCSSWPVSVRKLMDYDTDAANTYLEHAGRLAVIPSRMDNSPYTVLECLARRIPFICADVGGVAELVPAAQREEICFEPRLDFLLQRIHGCLRSGVAVPGVTTECRLAHQRWLALHDEMTERGERETNNPPGIAAMFDREPLMVVLARSQRRLLRWVAANTWVSDRISAGHTLVIAVPEGLLSPWAESEAIAGSIVLPLSELPAHAGDRELLVSEDFSVITAEFFDTARMAAMHSGATVVTSVVCQDPESDRDDRRADTFPISTGLPCGLFRASHGEHAAYATPAVWPSLLQRSGFLPASISSVRMFILECIAAGCPMGVVPDPLLGRIDDATDGHDPDLVEATLTRFFRQRLPGALAELPQYATAMHRTLFGNRG